jgi:serine/threonine-protein kinase PknK
MFCDCIAGVAAHEQLDIATAEACYRTALNLAQQTGKKSHATHLAGALLGELFYEKGQFVEAEELLDGGLGEEGGGIWFLLATYGIGARLAVIKGDLATAQQRLDEGAKIAESLALPRLGARLVNERIRLGLPISDSDRDALTQLRPFVRQLNPISAMIAELAHDSAIRLLLVESNRAATELAHARAEQLVQEIAQQDRPRALLQAQLLLGCCLSALDRTKAAAELLAPVLRRCADLGLARPVIDSGRQLKPVIEMLSEETAFTPQPPRSFLRRLLAEFEHPVP